MKDIHGGSETILLVEDEILLLEFVRSLLESNGYKVLIASDGQEAIEIYTQYQKDIALVISDTGMPKLGGVDEFKKLRKINPGVKIILSFRIPGTGGKKPIAAGRSERHHTEAVRT